MGKYLEMPDKASRMDDTNLIHYLTEGLSGILHCALSENFK